MLLRVKSQWSIVQPHHLKNILYRVRPLCRYEPCVLITVLAVHNSDRDGQRLIQPHCNPGFILRNSCDTASGSNSHVAFSIDASPALGVAAGLEPIPGGDYTRNKLPLHHSRAEAEKTNSRFLSRSHLPTV